MARVTDIEDIGRDWTVEFSDGTSRTLTRDAYKAMKKLEKASVTEFNRVYPTSSWVRAAYDAIREEIANGGGGADLSVFDATPSLSPNPKPINLLPNVGVGVSSDVDNYTYGSATASSATTADIVISPDQLVTTRDVQFTTTDAGALITEVKLGSRTIILGASSVGSSDGFPLSEFGGSNTRAAFLKNLKISKDTPLTIKIKFAASGGGTVRAMCRHSEQASASCPT